MEVEGEAAIAEDPRRIAHVGLNAPARPYGPVLQAISDAELITLGPGSLFTSIIPSLLVNGIGDAMLHSSAERVVLMNLMTQPGETDDYTAHDHLRVLSEYIDMRHFHAVLVNNRPPPEELLIRYREQGSIPVKDDLQGNKAYGLQVIRAPLLTVTQVAGRPTVKHDAAALAQVLATHTQCFRRSWTRWFIPKKGVRT